MGCGFLIGLPERRASIWRGAPHGRFLPLYLGRTLAWLGPLAPVDWWSLLGCAVRLPGLSGRGRTVSALQLMEQRGSNVGRVETLFEKPFEKLILTLIVPALERRADLIEHGIRTGLFHLLHT